MGGARYSEAFKSKIVEKLLRPNGPSACAVSLVGALIEDALHQIEILTHAILRESRLGSQPTASPFEPMNLTDPKRAEGLSLPVQPMHHGAVDPVEISNPEVHSGVIRRTVARGR